MSRLSGLILLIALAGLACRHAPQAIVPVQPSSAQQLDYAYKYRQSRNLDLIAKEQNERYLQSREIVRQHFEKVAEYFPADRKFTPLAKLELLEMEAGLDSGRVPVSTREIHSSVADLKKLMAEYPEIDFLQAKAMLDTGKCHKRLGEFEEGKVSFQNLIERYGKSKDSLIKEIVAKARVYYNQTEVKR